MIATAIFLVLFLLWKENIIKWNFWIISMPLFILFLTLLVLTQSRRLTRAIPMLVRLAWLFCIICMTAFLILYNLKEQKIYEVPIDMLFVPWWAFLIVSFSLGIMSLSYGCSGSSNRHSKAKWGGLLLLVIVIIISPFVLMLQFKLEPHNYKFSWAYVFIPIFVLDLGALLGSLILCIFTVGSPSEAIFSVCQVLSFLLMLPFWIAFKILLILKLEDATSEFPLYVVFIPMFIVQFLCCCCGVQMRLS